jgi:hypothetical protein
MFFQIYSNVDYEYAQQSDKRAEWIEGKRGVG